MLKESARKLGAATLLAALWFGAVAAVPMSTLGQASEDKKPSTEQTARQDDRSKTQTTADVHKPLSTKEDPSMIGKRKINSGTDKLFGWLGGSQEKEIALGRQLAMEVEQQAKMVDDPVVTEYVNRVGQNIVLHSDAKIPFTIKVIDSDEVNAFALPGGFFFVNKGLILAADNEAELAGVMAHEIAHVAARHAMENQGKLQAINYGLLATIIFGGGIASTIAQNAGGFGQLLSFLQFSRNAESEADNLGVQYLYAAGYDPTAMSTMFEKLSAQNKKKPGTLSKIFATHPQSLDRRDASLALVARFPEKDEYVISTSEFQRVKAHLLKITNAKAGVTSDIDENENGRPTLKRRQPEAADQDPNDKGSSSSSDGPPQLKRKGEEPAPAPSPTPKP
jgi:predicted Zn-dependent protease